MSVESDVIFVTEKTSFSTIFEIYCVCVCVCVRVCVCIYMAGN